MMTVQEVANTIRAVNNANPTRFVYTVRVSAVQHALLEAEVLGYCDRRVQHCKGCRCDREIRICGVPVSAVPEFAPEIVHFATKPRDAARAIF